MAYLYMPTNAVLGPETVQVGVVVGGWGVAGWGGQEGYVGVGRCRWVQRWTQRWCWWVEGVGVVAKRGVVWEGWQMGAGVGSALGAGGCGRRWA